MGEIGEGESMSQKFSGFREDPGDAVKDLVRGRVF